jgi:hypothetical protein
MAPKDTVHWQGLGSLPCLEEFTCASEVPPAHLPRGRASDNMMASLRLAMETGDRDIQVPSHDRYQLSESPAEVGIQVSYRASHQCTDVSK